MPMLTWKLLVLLVIEVLQLIFRLRRFVPDQRSGVTTHALAAVARNIKIAAVR
jgi:hypothetical protein